MAGLGAGDDEAERAVAENEYDQDSAALDAFVKEEEEEETEGEKRSRLKNEYEEDRAAHKKLCEEHSKTPRLKADGTGVPMAFMLTSIDITAGKPVCPSVRQPCARISAYRRGATGTRKPTHIVIQSHPPP